MFTLDWTNIGKIALLGLMGYVALILLLRIAGKRSLSQLNAFDLVVTVSIGSILATIMLDQKVSIFDGITALATLLLLQWIFTMTTIKSEKLDDVATADPTLLYYNGSFCKNALNKERIQEEEIIQSVRINGDLSMEQVKAVVIEPNGEISILPEDETEKIDTLQNLENKK